MGYLPQDAAQRTQRIRELEAVIQKSGQSQLFIETPYRNTAMWDALLKALQPGTRLQQRRNGGAVDPGLPRKLGLGDPPCRHRLGQAGAELGGAVAFVDFIHHLQFIQNQRGVKFTISRIPATGAIW